MFCEKPKPPLAKLKLISPVASAIDVTLASAPLPTSAVILNVSPTLLFLPPSVIITSDKEPTIAGISSCIPSDDLAMISPLKKLPLKFDSCNTCTLTWLSTFVEIDSTNALAPLVPPTISSPSKDIIFSKLGAYTSMYLGFLNSDELGFRTSSLGNLTSAASLKSILKSNCIDLGEPLDL